MSENSKRVTDEQALAMHASGRPGKLEILPTKPLTTQRDLSLAYSPGVAAPCLEIAADASKAYDYTAKGNMVAVVSNGTAVLGLGDLGGLASKPVMEGKAVLFKRFADVDGVDLCVDTKDVEEFVNCVKHLAPSFGGINLEDIKAPDCFIIEQRLKQEMNIPVFHDDQHGTAIIAAAGLLNATKLTNRRLEDVKVVVNGAGAAAIACVELMKSLGVPHENVTLCDSKGVIYVDRPVGMNQWKSAHAIETEARTLEDALVGADMFLGLSVQGAVTKEMVKEMADQPIIFALANPNPEITPEEVAEVRDDAIMATGRSDYPNQVNNVLGFPYLFRGALDVRATELNDEMKLAAVKALAELAQEDVPEEVDAAYAGRRLRFGAEYIIPVPFDPRLIARIPAAVAAAAMESGVAQKPIEDMDAYQQELRARLDPTADAINMIYKKIQDAPKRVVFAEGEQIRTIRAALAYQSEKLGQAILIGREEIICEHLAEMGMTIEDAGFEIQNAALSEKSQFYIDQLYARLQRRGRLYRDCQRLVNQGRNTFGALMVANGDADAMVTGLSRSFSLSYNEVLRVLDPAPNKRVMGLHMAINRGRTIFVCDTTVHQQPNAEELCDIATQAAAMARKLGHTPRVAFVSFSNFGQPYVDRADAMRDAVQLLSEKDVDFEFDGEMTVDVALKFDMMRRLYPFSRLTGPANILVMPGLHSAHIGAKLLSNLGNGEVIGPITLGLEKPVQIVPMGATANDMLYAAALAACQAIDEDD